MLAAAHTIAQDEESCGVLGMEKVAIEMKAVNSVMPLDHIFASNTGGLKSEGR
nr:chemotaxis protein CheB [Marinobacterium ramblicola]